MEDDLPYVLEIGGRTVVLDDGDARLVLDKLVRQTRHLVWLRAGGPDSMFRSYYKIWENHNRCHSINIFVLAMEALGGADLPSASWANRLDRQNRQLGRLLTPRGIGRFYQEFSRYNRDQVRFVRAMKTYQSRMIDGGTATVGILEVTRDASFVVLSVCASILTAGAASGATATAASSVSGALVRSAAANFLTTQIQHSATRLGRSMAGENVTMQETTDDIVNSALNAVSDAALGQIVGEFMSPLTGQLSDFSETAISRGNILRGVSLELSRSQIEDAVGRSIDQIIRRRPADIRALLRASQRERNARGHANIVANGLMQNRNFRRILESELQREI